MEREHDLSTVNGKVTASVSVHRGWVVTHNKHTHYSRLNLVRNAPPRTQLHRKIKLDG